MPDLFGDSSADESSGDTDGVDVPASAWRQFELDVEEHITSHFEDATVQHDVKLPGQISRRDRQVDVLVEGSVAGSQMRVVIECKRNATKKIGIGTVDAFAGKLQDVGAERGVLWAFGGFDAGARARAEGALNPKIELRTPEDFDADRDVDPEFFSAMDCPCDGCWGEISWHDDEGDETGAPLSVGRCDSCGTLAGVCPECEEIAALDHGTWQCWGCGGTWRVTPTRKYKSETVDWFKADE